MKITSDKCDVTSVAVLVHAGPHFHGIQASKSWQWGKEGIEKVPGSGINLTERICVSAALICAISHLSEWLWEETFTLCFSSYLEQSLGWSGFLFCSVRHSDLNTGSLIPQQLLIDNKSNEWLHILTVLAPSSFIHFHIPCFHFFKYSVLISFPQISPSHWNDLISTAIPAESRLIENLKCCIVHVFDSVVVMLLKPWLAWEL